MTLSIRRPDDWHLHLRDGAMLRAVAPSSAAFGRAMIMPNLIPPIVTAQQALDYQLRIEAALPSGAALKPLMTLYLTEATKPSDVVSAHASGLIAAVKLYPAGATTNSDSGVKDIERVRTVLEAMAEHGVPLCVHGEVTSPDVDIFDREAVFLDTVLEPLRRAVPQLRVILEHVTTRDGVDYVAEGGPDLAATITTHHLVINRNAILAGGIRPHNYCLPVAKREEHRLALRKAATQGTSKFFLGTDSAPHPDTAKLQPCGCAGCFTALNTLPILAQLFEDDGTLSHLEAFTSLNGPAFYRMEPNSDHITLTRRDTPASYPTHIEAEGEVVTVFDPGFPLYWHSEDRS